MDGDPNLGIAFVRDRLGSGRISFCGLGDCRCLKVFFLMWCSQCQECPFERTNGGYGGTMSNHTKIVRYHIKQMRVFTHENISSYFEKVLKSLTSFTISSAFSSRSLISRHVLLLMAMSFASFIRNPTSASLYSSLTNSFCSSSFT